MNTDLSIKKPNGGQWITHIMAALLTLSCLASIAPVYAFHFPWDQGHDTTNPNGPPPPGPCPGGNCQNDPCNKNSQGSPVYLATGHFIWTETDVELKGRPNLVVTRTYNSHDPRVGILGNGWNMSCEESIILTYRASGNTLDRIVVRKLSNGKRYEYEQVGSNGRFFEAPGLFDTVEIMYDGSNTIRLIHRDGSYKVFPNTGFAGQTFDKLISEVDRNGNTINYTYDSQGRLTQKADTNGRSLNYEYNTNGLISIIRDHTGREWQYGYDINANLISVTDPLSGVRQYAYEAYQGVGDGQTYQHLTQVTDEIGVVETEVTYNQERVASYKEFENTFTYQYDTANRRATKTDSQGSRWVFNFNETGQYTRIEKPLNRTEIYDRDENSLLTRFVDPSGTEYSYTYDEHSNLLTETDDRGTITNIYDNANPWQTSISSRSGRVTVFTFDDNGNPLTTTDPNSAVTTMSWSVQGDLQQVTDALGNQTSMNYSAQGMMLSSSDPLGRITQYEYDALNNVNQVTNAANEVMQYEYDALDRIVSSTDENGDITTYAYDAADRVTQVTAPNGQTVQYSYDNFGRLNQRIFYDGAIFRYGYRSDNLASQIIRPDNVIISMTYDAAKRLSGRTIGSEDNYNYSYNLRDELTSISNGTGTVTIAYDNFGRITSETVNAQTTTYQYNVEDENTQLVSLGTTQDLQYDVRGLLNQLDVNGSSYQYSYDVLERLTALNRTNVTNTSMQYDIANQLTDINHGSGQRDYQYQYDTNGRITQWQGVAGETRNYGYDNASRLTTVQSSSNSETFTYDAMGNRQNDNAQFDVANRITEDNSFTYIYDINGNRTLKANKSTGEVERYTYNSLDQLVGYQAYSDSVPDTLPTVDYSYSYGPLGRRWLKQNNLSSNSVMFYWSGSNLIGENNLGIVRRYILEGITPVGFIENGENYHFLKDHLGTIHEIIDSNGNIVWQGDYGSFGVLSSLTNSIENNLRLPGQYEDVETGLFYNYFRDYDPELGRYIQSDPIGLEGGMNTYIYATANPLSVVDLDGLIWVYVIRGGKWVLQWLGKKPTPKKPTKLPKKPQKGTWSCICKIRYAPPDCQNCPGRVAGLGLTKNAAQNAAKNSAPAKCRAFYGHCECHQSRK